MPKKVTIASAGALVLFTILIVVLIKAKTPRRFPKKSPFIFPNARKL